MKKRTKKILPLLLCVIGLMASASDVFGQQTPCAEEFSQIVTKVTLDYAGYRDKTRGKEKELAALTRRIKNQAAETTDFAACTSLLQRWVNHFHDGHLMLVVKGTERFELEDYTKQQELLKPSLKKLNKDTIVLKIPAFDLNYKPAIDDLLKTHNQELTMIPTLILDLRGNRGGGDSSFRNLLPLLYTGPIKQLGADVWASKGNIEFYQHLIQNKTFPEEVKQYLRQLIVKMEAAPGQFVPISEDSRITLDSVSPLPKQVAILIDKDNGSTTEQFLLAAKQSGKVKLFGKTNTAGILDYANVTNTDLVSGKRILLVPSSRSRRLPKNPVDGIGIAPDVRIPQAVSDEIAYIHRYLKSH
jgi:hypothetical protein